MLIATACDNQVTEPAEEEPTSETTFIPFSQNNSKTNSVSEAPSKFGCTLSTLNKKSAEYNYRYQSFYIQFSDEVMEQADGNTVQTGFTVSRKQVDGRAGELFKAKGIVRFVTCRIPDAPKAFDILEKEMEKFGPQTWVNDFSSKGANAQGAKDGDTTSDWVEQCSLVPGDGFGNTSSTIYVGDGEGYTVYYFHIECEWVHVPESGGGDEYGDGGGEIGEDDDPGPCQFNSPTDGGSGSTIGCSDGGGSGEGDTFEVKIIDSELDPCMQDELDMLVTVEQGVGSIVQDFAIDELNPEIANFNWKVEDGDLPNNVNGRTSTEYDSGTNTVTTKFDTDKFGNATDLSIARTMLHEAVHAWVVSITFTDDLSTEERNALLGDNWMQAFENQGHNFIATDFVKDIADALEAFGNTKGYNLNRQFYEDMGWGGLFNTPEFANKSAQEQQNIKDTIHAEQYGTDTNGNYQSQKGNNAGC